MSAFAKSGQPARYCSVESVAWSSMRTVLVLVEVSPAWSVATANKAGKDALKQLLDKLFR
jgi:hypothetical protein